MISKLNIKYFYAITQTCNPRNQIIVQETNNINKYKILPMFLAHTITSNIISQKSELFNIPHQFHPFLLHCA